MFYSGSSGDGSDAREVCGMFINPENNGEWSSMPYNKEQRLIYNVYEHLRKEGHGLHKEMELIEAHKSKLGSNLRKQCIEIFNFLYN